MHHCVTKCSPWCGECGLQLILWSNFHLVVAHVPISECVQLHLLLRVGFYAFYAPNLKRRGVRSFFFCFGRDMHGYKVPFKYGITLAQWHILA